MWTLILTITMLSALDGTPNDIRIHSIGGFSTVGLCRTASSEIMATMPKRAYTRIITVCVEKGTER